VDLLLVEDRIHRQGGVGCSNRSGQVVDADFSAEMLLMTKEEAERFWRIYGRAYFANPPTDPTFEDLYQAIKVRLANELWALEHGGDTE
jgi:hypothetical protein